jgi:pSer/pThr/pTyr-binding forkhead associated (FHA) protein
MPFLQFRDSRYPLKTGENRLGWGEGVEVRLPDAGEPAQGAAVAALLRIDAAGAAVASRAGEHVRLNGLAVGEAVPILHGDKLALFGLELRFGDEGQLGETMELATDVDVAIAVPSPAARNARADGRLVSLVDGREYEVGQSALTIGRDPSCDIVIGAPVVSRRHATLRRGGDGYIVLDTSANGVFVNEGRVQAELPLGSGDRLRVGNEEFRFYASAGPTEPSTPNVPALEKTGAFQAVRRPTPASVPTQPAEAGQRTVLGYFEVLNEGPSKGQRIEITSPRVNIGRGQHNDVVLPDESVSDAHAKLQRREEGWFLIDLESTNGTYVAGERVADEVRVMPGADVRFGGVKLAFRALGSTARPSGETRVIVGLRGPDPKRAEARLKELVDRAQPDTEPRPQRRMSPTVWIIVMVILAVAGYVVWGRGGR